MEIVMDMYADIDLALRECLGVPLSEAIEVKGDVRVASCLHILRITPAAVFSPFASRDYETGLPFEQKIVELKPIRTRGGITIYAGRCKCGKVYYRNKRG